VPLFLTVMLNVIILNVNKIDLIVTLSITLALSATLPSAAFFSAMLNVSIIELIVTPSINIKCHYAECRIFLVLC
jgi:hypothetical protein